MWVIFFNLPINLLSGHAVTSRILQQKKKDTKRAWLLEDDIKDARGEQEVPAKIHLALKNLVGLKPNKPFAKRSRAEASGA